MKLLTLKESADWTRSVTASPVWEANAPPPRSRGHLHGLRVLTPQSPSGIIGLAYIVAVTGVEDFSEDRYEGGLLYLQNWAIGSESIEQVGYALLARIRGEEELAVGDSPGHQIEPAEFVLAQTMLSIPMLFGWDAWYVAKNRSLSAAISHDGFVDLFSPSEHQTEDLRHRLDGQSVQTFIKE